MIVAPASIDNLAWALRVAAFSVRHDDGTAPDLSEVPDTEWPASAMRFLSMMIQPNPMRVEMQEPVEALTLMTTEQQAATC